MNQLLTTFTATPPPVSRGDAHLLLKGARRGDGWNYETVAVLCCYRYGNLSEGLVFVRNYTL